MPGVVAFYDHKAIAGKNSCVIYDIDEPIFSEGKIMYAGQAVGVIVAETADLVPFSTHFTLTVPLNLRRSICKLVFCISSSIE